MKDFPDLPMRTCVANRVLALESEQLALARFQSGETLRFEFRAYLGRLRVDEVDLDLASHSDDPGHWASLTALAWNLLSQPGLSVINALMGTSKCFGPRRA